MEKKWEKEGNWKKQKKQKKKWYLHPQGRLSWLIYTLYNANRALYIKDKKTPVSFGQNTYVKVDKDNVKNVICVKCVNQAHV